MGAEPGQAGSRAGCPRVALVWVQARAPLLHLRWQLCDSPEQQLLQGPYREEGKA